MRVKKAIASSGSSVLLTWLLLQSNACSDSMEPSGPIVGASGKGGAPGASGAGALGGAGGGMTSGVAGSQPAAGTGGGSGAATGGVGGTSVGAGGVAGAAGSGVGAGGASGGSGGNGATAGVSGGGSSAGGQGGTTSGGGGAGGGNGGSSGNGGGSSGSGGGGTVTDPFEILGKLRPSGSAGNDYDAWMEDEIGTPVVASTAVSNGNINAPILVPAGVVYDGKGQTIKPSIPGCSGSQTESQPPVFILVPGAGLKNVTISPPACDGVHMMGNNTLENVTWTDVGEDAASVRSYFPGGKITIKGGSLKSADDKAFQFNAPVQVTISDLTATNISKLVRQNGGKTFAMSVHLSNVKVSQCKEAVVRGGPNLDFTHQNVTADCPLWADD